MKLRPGQFVALTDDPDFCMGTTLLWVDTPYILVPFGNILYHLGKLYTDLKLSYFMHLAALNPGVKISLLHFYHPSLQTNSGFSDLSTETFFRFHQWILTIGFWIYYTS